MNTLASWAQQLARALLEEALSRRWAHVQGVAAQARSLAPVLGADAGLLEAAAWLHDVGYAPGLAVTGLHALDGARYLRGARHADAMLCRCRTSLLRHYRSWRTRARRRPEPGVRARAGRPFQRADLLRHDDQPDGEPVPVDRWLAEIQQRYGPGHLVSRSIQRATPMILRAVEQVQGQNRPRAHSSANRTEGILCPTA